MNKPKRKKTASYADLINSSHRDSILEDIGYNRAYDEWEAFLPDKKEMKDIIKKHFKKVKIISTEWVRTQIALAISKRIRGEE